VIHGARIRQSRLFLGETQGVFGVKVGLSQVKLSLAEAGEVEPSEAVLLNMSEHTGFPPGFFAQPPLAPIDVMFRARTRVKAADRNRCISCAEIIHESAQLMREQIKPMPVYLTEMHGEAPERAAQETRAVLDLDANAPITNLTLPLERIGVLVLALPVIGNKHDAFSWWQRDLRKSYPVIASLVGGAGDRLRWNLAHELGHLILHRHKVSFDAEREADRFAAELLTPLKGLQYEMPGAPTLASLYALKVRWGVSAQSLIRRARELGVIDDVRYMSLFRQISARGERMNERFQIRREKPRAYRKMAEVIFGENPANGLSAFASWTPEFAADVLDQFATQAELPSRRRPIVRKAGDLAEVVPIRNADVATGLRPRAVQ